MRDSSTKLIQCGCFGKLEVTSNLKENLVTYLKAQPWKSTTNGQETSEGNCGVLKFIPDFWSKTGWIKKQ